MCIKIDITINMVGNYLKRYSTIFEIEISNASANLKNVESLGLSFTLKDSNR